MITPHQACLSIILFLASRLLIYYPTPQSYTTRFRATRSASHRISSLKHTFISVLVILAQVQPIVALACYNTDGTEASKHTVCNGTASVSHCCTNLEACLTNSLVKQSHRSLYGTTLYTNILLVLLCSGSIHKRWHVYRPFVARQQLLSIVPNNTSIPESFDKYLISLRLWILVLFRRWKYNKLLQ